MKLLFEKDCKKTQPDPFMFEADGKYYMYVTAGRGVEAYTADTPFSEWHYAGIVCTVHHRGGRLVLPLLLLLEAGHV